MEPAPSATGAPRKPLDSPSLFLGGLLAIPRGGRFLLAHRELMRLALVPLIVSVAVFSLALGLSVAYYGEILSSLTRWLDLGAPEHWWVWILVALAKVAKFLIGVILALALAAVGLLSATVLGNLIASPFNDALCARVEEIASERKGPGDGPGGIRGIARDTKYAIANEAKKLGFFLIAEIALLSLNLIPGVGSFLFAVLNTLFAVYFMALEYLDYPLSRERVSFRGKRAFLGRYRMPSLGLGLAVFVTFFIPGLNFLCMPLAVTGATLLYCDIRSQTVVGSDGREEENRR